MLRFYLAIVILDEVEVYTEVNVFGTFEDSISRNF